MRSGWAALASSWVVALVLAGCVDQRCYENADCPSPKRCGPAGTCVYECSTAAQCSAGFDCIDHVCQPSSTGPISCPADMVAVASTFCIDRYEASRPDATSLSIGLDQSRARSVAHVMPWQVASLTQAEQACQAAEKRLCGAAEWQSACQGPNRTAYAYGNTYEPTTCNGIDTFGRDHFHLMPTGSFADCTNAWGAYDLNGNLWEYLAGGSDQTVRGGAYNCSDSATFHRCDFVPGSWTPVARGFRCCLDPLPITDGGPQDGANPGGDGGSPGDGLIVAGDGGCLSGDGADAGPDGDGAVSGDTHLAGDTATGDSMIGGDASTEQGHTCPHDMLLVGAVCMDVYEASRADATSSSAGTSTSATSRVGVLPWFPVTLAQARAGCTSEGKRLCRPDEWVGACHGPGPTALTYAYGDTYDPDICNGIDTFCSCSVPACSALLECPYPHCYNQASSTETGGPCGASFHVMPTGSFSGCVSAAGLYDLNGNVWELGDTSDGIEHFHGGAFNCSDSVTYHRCDYEATWGPSAKGFRCCKAPALP